MDALVVKHGYSFVNKIEDKDNVVIIEDTKHNKYIMKLFSNVIDFNNELHYYRLASQHHIAPNIRYDIDDLIIISKKMNPLVNEDGILINKNIIDDQFIQNVDNKINMMHKLGFAHGDLSAYNIVYDDDNIPFLIDFEKSYEIHNHTWETELWMRAGFCWDKSYEDFVNYDYINWKEMLMLPLTSSFSIRGLPPSTGIFDFRIHVNENYYDIRFNINNYDICCGTFAKCLQQKLGGIIYGICNKDPIPVHYVLLIDKFMDCTGVYADEESMIKMVKSRYGDELDGELICYKVDQNTLDNVDYECDITNEKINKMINHVITYHLS